MESLWYLRCMMHVFQLLNNSNIKTNNYFYVKTSCSRIEKLFFLSLFLLLLFRLFSSSYRWFASISYIDNMCIVVHFKPCLILPYVILYLSDSQLFTYLYSFRYTFDSKRKILLVVLLLIRLYAIANREYPYCLPFSIILHNNYELMININVLFTFTE